MQKEINQLNEDMKSLYDIIYELKKEIKDLKSKINELSPMISILNQNLENR